MPISKVQDSFATGGPFTGNVGLVNNITTTALNTLIVCGNWFNPNAATGILSITDSAGNTWQYATSDSNNPPSAHTDTTYGAFVAWVIGAAAVTSVTMKLTGTGACFGGFTVSEWTGIGSADAGIAATVTVPSGGNITPGTLTLGGSGELVVASLNVQTTSPTGLPSGLSRFTNEHDNLSGWGTGFSGTFTAPWTGGGVGEADTPALMAFLGGMTVSPSSIPAANVNSYYTQTITASGGTPPYAFTVSAGTLPAWATLNASSGVLAGAVPNGSGSQAITVKATDSLGATATRAYTLSWGAPQPVGSPSGGPWVLVFNDEFDFPVQAGLMPVPNPAVWADHFIMGDSERYNFGNSETQWYPHNKAGLEVANSILTLHCRPESPNSTSSVGYDPLAPSTGQHGQSFSFTSGWVQSHPGFQATYGYWEARMAIPVGVSNSWPSFWMTTADAHWPPEFDVEEKVGGSGVPAVVIGGYFSAGSLGSKTYQVPNQTDDGAFHVWGMRWSPNDITWFKDGVQTGTYTTAASITNLPQHMQLQHATVFNGLTGFPADVQFDYVRYWQVSGVPAQPAITSISPASGVPSSGSVVVNFGAVSGATSYRVCACPVDGIADSVTGLFADPPTWTVFTGTSSPITATGLQNGARYTFSVAAINATGYSIESPLVPSLAPPVVPLMASFP